MDTSPASGSVHAGSSEQSRSSYPPGIEAIMRSKGKGKEAERKRAASCCDSVSSTGTLDAQSRFGYLRPNTPDSADISCFYREAERSPSLLSPRPERSATGLTDWSISDEDIVVSSRATAISLVQNVQQNLGRLCDGMDLTIKECFPRKKHRFEVPSYKGFRLSLLRFIETLANLEKLLAEPTCFVDDTAVRVAFYVLRSPLDFIVSECFCILQGWDRRRLEHDSEAKQRRLRAYVVCCDDERLHILKKQVILVDATVLRELKQRCPNMTMKAKSGRAWRWLKYLQPVCPGFGACDHDEHRLRLLLAIRRC